VCPVRGGPTLDEERLQLCAPGREDVSGVGDAVSVNGDSNYVRVQVITNKDALDRDKQLAAVRRLADVVAESAGDTGLADRTWVILTDTYDGGWGIAGHANTNEEIVALARRTSQ
jgi:phenylpyruvate tautomerase PptA (4-oxalocrotonate tautomerase family)